MHSIQSLYHTLKDFYIIGPILKGVRAWYRQSYFARRKLFKRDWNHARSVVMAQYPDNTEALQLLDRFCRSSFFKQSFSYGHSGDYDAMILYILTRMQKPAVVIETGVASGRSSTAILTALAENESGHLHSIDLPQHYKDTPPSLYETHEGNQELTGFVPEGEQPGWLVPDALRERWTLHLGDSRELLPKLLHEVKTVDIFCHDSDHGYESIAFECAAAWPTVPPGGFLLCDDTDWNEAWQDFLKAATPESADKYRHFGIARKSL